jgi:hypothetical protein
VLARKRPARDGIDTTEVRRLEQRVKQIPAHEAACTGEQSGFGFIRIRHVRRKLNEQAYKATSQRRSARCEARANASKMYS